MINEATLSCRCVTIVVSDEQNVSLTWSLGGFFTRMNLLTFSLVKSEIKQGLQGVELLMHTYNKHQAVHYETTRWMKC